MVRFPSPRTPLPGCQVAKELVRDPRSSAKPNKRAGNHSSGVSSLKRETLRARRASRRFPQTGKAETNASLTAGSAAAACNIALTHPKLAAQMTSLQERSGSHCGRDTAPQASSEQSEPAPESSNFRPIATQTHTAPPASMILAGVVEIEYALRIFTLADSCVVRPSKEIRGIVRHND